MMKISKTRLKEIIKEEINETFEDRLARAKEIEPGVDFEAEETSLNSPRQAGREWAIKNLRVAINRAAGAGLSNDEIRKVIEDKIESGTEHGRVTSTGPWAPEKLQEEGRTDQGWLDALKQKYGRKAAHFTVNDIQKLHPSYKGSLRDIAQGLGIR